MSERIIQGHVGIGPSVTGPALVAHDNFSARYDLDRINGVFSRPAHKLYGESYLGKILILNAAKGGVASAWMLYEMAARQKGPLALILNFANPIMAQGAAHADLPMVDRFDCDITAEIQTGDAVRVEPDQGRVIVLGGGG